MVKRMIENMVQPQECSIENIFLEHEYIIPIYQRNYAWSKEEIEQLLDDINDINRKYYLGSLIVNEIERNRFEVIDGQQRLTTLFLLLSYLKYDSIKIDSLRFEAREKSNKTLKAIYETKAGYKEFKNEEEYSTDIIEGYSIIENYFLGKDADFISRFEKKISSVYIIRTQVPKDIDLNHYFEIMNTRGEQLELHEIVKAKIIGAIETDGKITDDDRIDKVIAGEIWDACAQMDKYIQMSFSTDKRKKLFSDDWDSFKCKSFDDIRIAFNGCSRDETKYESETSKLKDILIKKQNNLKQSNDEDKEENERFDSIISFPNFILQVNEAMNILEAENENDAGLDDKKFIEFLKNRWSNKEKSLDFVYSLLKYRYLFDRYIIKREYYGNHKSEGKWSLKKCEINNYDKGNKPIYKTTLNIDEEDKNNLDNKQLTLLESCLRITYTSPKTMHWIAKVISEVNKGKTGKEIIKILEKYCCKKVDDSDYKNSKGFAVERIVFTYLDYILCRDNLKKYEDFEFQFRKSIEHFFPQHPINEEYKIKDENKDSFGNLALITVSANSKFSNMLPTHKVEQYREVVKQSPKLIQMKNLILDNNRKWDDECIEQHNDEMLKLLEDEIKKHNDF
ncbi:DUF262 domain-containing protein [Parvimonas micra]|uniref:DUF262 domain-containing protein n=2 Tax=Parvimonas micra TaxID=33033 RepID=A8SJ34_9FIRM|nr:DUF262 domain-containing protein [Parvimonas micra]EDP24587.1 hypothetical protein PEPMIC_00440 [Parvimonas micra ATCC 33270]